MPSSKKTTHGGKRIGAGRKPALLPLHTKKLRASAKDWDEFLSYLTDDARGDFLLILTALKLLYESMPNIRTRKQSND